MCGVAACALNLIMRLFYVVSLFADDAYRTCEGSILLYSNKYEATHFPASCFDCNREKDP